MQVSASHRVIVTTLSAGEQHWVMQASICMLQGAAVRS